MARLRDETLRVEESFVDDAGSHRNAVTLASFNPSRAAQLHHRYEVAHDCSLRATMHLLMALAKSGVDAPEEAETEPQSPTEPTNRPLKSLAPI